VCVNIFGAIVLKPRFKIDVVIMIICSIVIIIHSVLTLQVSAHSLERDKTGFNQFDEIPPTI
jgi:hypothetical protein